MPPLKLSEPMKKFFRRLRPGERILKVGGKAYKKALSRTSVLSNTEGYCLESNLASLNTNLVDALVARGYFASGCDGSYKLTPIGQAIHARQTGQFLYWKIEVGISTADEDFISGEIVDAPDEFYWIAKPTPMGPDGPISFSRLSVRPGPIATGYSLDQLIRETTGRLRRHGYRKDQVVFPDFTERMRELDQIHIDAIIERQEKRLAAEKVYQQSAKQLAGISEDHPYFTRLDTVSWLSTRTLNCLSENGIVYFADAAQMSSHEFMSLPKFGRKSLNEVKEALAAVNLYVGMSLADWELEEIKRVRTNLPQS